MVERYRKGANRFRLVWHAIALAQAGAPPAARPVSLERVGQETLRRCHMHRNQQLNSLIQG